MSFEDYCELFKQPKNKSGYKFITDKSETTGWFILWDGRSHYGLYQTLQDALQEAYRAGLNLPFRASPLPTEREKL